MASTIARNKPVEETETKAVETIKVIKVRDINYKEAKNEVLGYYRTYKEAYPHEVADELELDYDLVWKITEELKEEKRLEVVE
ncbi:MAG: hypothetical protein WA977_10055 [Halobacteriota archaeon]